MAFPFTLTLPRRAASAKAARDAVTAALSGMDSATVETAELLASELVTNAVLHARTQVELLVEVAAADVLVAVSDHDPTLPRRRDPDPGDLSGRGLMLVETLAACWGVEPLGHGKTVWCVIAGETAGSGPP